MKHVQKRETEWQVQKNNSHHKAFMYFHSFILITNSMNLQLHASKVCHKSAKSVTFSSRHCTEVELPYINVAHFYRIRGSFSSSWRTHELTEANKIKPMFLFRWFALSWLGLVSITFPVLSDLVKALKATLFAGYKPINQVKRRELQCIYLGSLKYRWGWLLFLPKYFSSANVKEQNHSITSRET